MKTKTFKYLLIAIVTFFLTSFTIIQKEEIKDYLSFGGQIVFNKETYNLKWASNPSLNYYKQEYLRQEDQFPNYQKMMIIEAIKGNLTVAQAANAKITELENWKKRNPIVKYEKLENKEKNEIIVDFILSDGKSIYEWNVYRYQEQKNTSENYLVLYCYSYRNYISEKADETKFLDFVSKTRTETITKIQKSEIPKVKTN